ncbi:hypothetical protein NQZ68_028579, partial [Dissostichus eleginoides]
MWDRREQAGYIDEEIHGASGGSAMDQCEDREEGAPPSKSSLCGGHDIQTKAQRIQPQRPGPGCESMKSNWSMHSPMNFKDGQSADE